MESRGCPVHFIGALNVARMKSGHLPVALLVEAVPVTTLQLPSLCAPFQDPRLLADLRASTGLDLRVGGGRRRRAGGPGPGLTDLRPASARRRLEERLFSACTVRRVAAALDRLDRRRHGDRFGDQFNYQVTGR